MSGDDIVCHWHGLGLIESDDGWSCPACTKPSNVKALLAEIERLRAELAAMVERGGDLARHGCPRCTGVDMPVPALCCVRCGSRWFTDD